MKINRRFSAVESERQADNLRLLEVCAEFMFMHYNYDTDVIKEEIDLNWEDISYLINILDADELIL